ncbi:NPCBM/NEW2 domain-containing protein [Jiangella sp. DSM 45060]|uniref:NPCBM/NEW2 domain-containing protein n=1 Tax=Jiangella sp. DSM 45060 TaxID=1798224 RepID=UPI00087A0801|nr:NPCBM/NEW2 domain-containing protein [Jiangella sp. DSM 45060]SDT63342.1 Alpha-glucosidase, glycosyl hydrolase family GH31 [Jiangella sp. DSM 45060]
MASDTRRSASALAAAALVLTFAGLAPATAAAPAASQQLGAIDDVTADGAATTFASGDARLRITFLDDDVFRVELAPDGTFTDPAGTPPSDPEAPDARIVIGDDGAGPAPELVETADAWELRTDGAVVTVGKDPILLSAATPDGRTLFAETAPLAWDGGATTQTLARGATEQFLGGGMQNGRFSHRDQTIRIEGNFDWDDGGYPNAVPWYLSTAGYGVLRNTFAPGSYAFGEPVRSTHSEERFDAYYVLGDAYRALDGYTELTGRPMLPPIYGLELGDADCYNTSSPTYSGDPKPGKLVTPDAVRVAEAYDEHDMPRGWMLVNDGYGCEYVDLEQTGDGLRDHDIELGLWTERGLTEQEYEVGEAGVRVRKLDVAWVGSGYRHALSACEDAYSGIEDNSDARGYVWMVEGWAGAQRCGVQWTGDHSGSLDSIRWQIPAIHGSGNSGLAFTAGDIDGIFGGSAESYVRDLQWKVFTPVLMTMSGWAGFDKQPWTRGEPYTSINRDYLKLRERLLPYFYSYAAEAHRSGAPVARSLVLEYPDDPNTWDDTTAHQFHAGREFLVAPVYEDSEVRDGIYLPEGTWVDYWTGRLYTGPATVDGYAAPLDRLPLFVKAGSVVPMWPAGVNNHADVAPDSRLTLDVYPWGEGSFSLYEDDGVTRAYASGESATQTFTVDAPTGTRGDVVVEIGARSGSYDEMAAERPYEITAHTGTAPGAVTAGGSRLPSLPTRAEYDAASAGWFFDGSVVWVKTAPVASGDALTVRLAGTSSVGGAHPSEAAGTVSVAAAPELLPGEPSGVEVSFTNGTGRAIPRSTLTVEVPSGWTAGAAPLGLVQPGETVTRTVPVTPPSSGAAGRSTITAVASWNTGPRTYDARAGATVTVPYGSLAEAFNVVAVTDDTATTAGDFDRGGNSYSAQALAAAGVTPGSTVTSRDVAFTWPSAAPGTPNGLRTAGQTVALRGQGTHLAVLGAEAGQVDGEFEIRYADGTVDTQSLRLPNWCCLPTDVGGSTIAVTTNYRNTQAGPANHGTAYRVFHNELRLLPGKEVVSVRLPDRPEITLFAAAFTSRSLPDPPAGSPWVSDVDWLSATNGWGPVERDTSNGEDAPGDGRPLSVGGVTHAKGLGVHADSRVSYYLGGACTRLIAVVGVDDEIPDYGSVRFSVVGDGELLHRSDVLTGLSDPVPLDVDLTGIHYLDLVVDGASDGVGGDHADWASARLTCT